jgi:hypothetical protein
MDRKYWMKVGATMLVIFVVGVVVVRGVRAGIDKGKSVLASVVPAGLPLMRAGFRFDGNRVGDINRLQLLRSTPGRVDSAVVTVSLDDAATLPQFPGCRLMVVDARQFNSHTSFACATSSDSADLQLTPFGHVVLEPGDQTVTLWVPNDARAELERDAGHGVGDSGDVDIQSDHGKFTITVGGRTIVEATGDSNGGSIIVRDSKGNPIVDIGGDSAGGHVKIMDSQGHTKVDIKDNSGHQE